MPLRFERYRMSDGKTPLAAGYFNPVLADIDLRIAQLEELKVSWNTAVTDITRFGLERINIALAPTLDQASALLEQLMSDATGFRAQIMIEVNASVESQLAPLEPASAASLSYDAQGRVTIISETLPTGTRTTTTTYNASGTIASLAISLGGTTRTETYAYNASGRLINMTAT